MNGIRLGALYVGIVFTVPVLFAYPLHAALELFVAPVRFERIVFRLMELAAVAGLWPVLRGLGQRGRRAWGLEGARWPSELGSGLVIGIVMMTVPVAVLIALDVRVIVSATDSDSAPFLLWILVIGLGAMVVSLVEELWFRGGLFTALTVGSGAVVAGTATSLVYALVHFVRPDRAIAPGTETWTSAFEVIGGSFDRLASGHIWDSLLALAIAGAVLAWRRMATGGIAQCIGIHAGWVIVIRLTRKFTELDPDSTAAALVGTYDRVIGLGVAVWFVSFALIWWCVAPSRGAPRVVRS